MATEIEPGPAPVAGAHFGPARRNLTQSRATLRSDSPALMAMNAATPITAIPVTVWLHGCLRYALTVITYRQSPAVTTSRSGPTGTTVSVLPMGSAARGCFEGVADLRGGHFGCLCCGLSRFHSASASSRSDSTCWRPGLP